MDLPSTAKDNLGTVDHVIAIQNKLTITLVSLSKTMTLSELSYNSLGLIEPEFKSALQTDVWPIGRNFQKSL